MDMNVTLLNPVCSNEDVVKYVRQHYFTMEERASAQRMMDEGTPYEEAIASLTHSCQYPVLRRSNDTQTHMLITLPNGVVKAWHPKRLFPDFQPVLVCSVEELARFALPYPESDHTINQDVPAQTVTYRTFSLFEGLPECRKEGQKEEKPKRSGVRYTKKLTYVEQTVHMGTHTTWWSRPGWVVKGHGLAYVLETRKPDWHQISVVHLKSNHVMACVYVTLLDEKTHQRVRSWMADILALTDWSQGIAALLKEKTGKRKKEAWSQHLEALWTKHRDRYYQFSLFGESGR